MIRTFIPMGGILVLVWGLFFTATTGSEHISAVLVVIMGAIVFAFVGNAMVTDADKNWLPSMVMAGFTAKIVASWVRWWVLVDFYNGSGDAVGYHGRGIQYAPLWRAFEVPELRIGTEAMEGIAGLAYFFYIPNFLGGFFLFASLAFVGQLFLYAAFRAAPIPRRHKFYAFVVFFVPTIVYWPSSIGKESVMLLGIGVAAYGVAKLLRDGSMGSLFPIAFGLILSGVIRPHVAGLVAVSATVALLFAKGPGVAQFPARRLTLLVFVGGALTVLTFVAAANFGISLDSLDELDGSVDEFVGTVEDNTTKGGSAVEGGFISSPLEFPEAALKVLFRPLPNEAHNPPALASSLEGALLLLVLVLKLPAIVRRGFSMRKDPYTLFAFVYTIGFIIAFSAFNNLGLMARERSQVAPFFLLLVVVLGWGPPPEPEEEPEMILDTVDELYTHQQPLGA